MRRYETMIPGMCLWSVWRANELFVASAAERPVDKETGSQGVGNVVACWEMRQRQYRRSLVQDLEEVEARGAEKGKGPEGGTTAPAVKHAVTNMTPQRLLEHLAETMVCLEVATS